MQLQATCQKRYETYVKQNNSDKERRNLKSTVSKMKHKIQNVGEISS